jgi:hypothetical protein
VITDDLGALQHAGDLGYRGPPHPEHLGEELLGEGELVQADTIVGQKHPAGATLLDGVKSVAGHLLAQLARKRLGVAPHDAREPAVTGKLAAKDPGVHAQGGSGHLDLEEFGRIESLGSPGQRDTDKSFVADRGHLDAIGPFRPGEQRDDRAEGEMTLSVRSPATQSGSFIWRRTS